jgi:hypothetical protein
MATQIDRTVQVGLGLRELLHVGIIVVDLAAAASDFDRRWGVSVMDVAEITLCDAFCFGRPAEVSLKHGFTRHGASDIELIQPLSDRSPYTDFLESHKGDVVHHLAYAVDDIDSHLRRLRPVGAELVLDAYLPNNQGRIVQIDGFAHGPIVELIQASAVSIHRGGAGE